MATLQLLKQGVQEEQWLNEKESVIEKTYMEWMNDPVDFDNKRMRKETSSDEEELALFKLLWKGFTKPYLIMGHAFEFTQVVVLKALPHPEINLFGRVHLILRVVEQLKEDNS
jgi:hypothetical protein